MTYPVDVSWDGDQPMRRISKAVFGQELRLSVMQAIARHPDGLFCLSDIVEQLDVRHASSVQEPLRALLASGLIERQEGLPGDKHRWYRRSESLAWAFAEELCERAQQASTEDLASH